MQFFKRLCANVGVITSAIIGIVVLPPFGSSGSKGLLAQQYFDSPPPVYNHAPNGTYGSYEIYPSNGYSGGYYDHAYSYPVLPVQPAPAPIIPSTTFESTGPAVVTSGSPLDSTSADAHKQNTEPKTSGFEKLRNALRDHVPSAASILGLENGMERSEEKHPQQFAESKPEDLAAAEAPAPEPIEPQQPPAPIATSDPVASVSVETPNPKPEPEPVQPVQELLAIQARIDAVLPRLLPTVIAVEGGSGVIVSSEGHVLTASHVTKKAGRTILVKLADGRSVQAMTLGTNVNSDTAALKLVGNGPWPFVEIGDSNATQLGDWCLAMGYPLSFERGRPAAVRLGRILQKSRSRFVTDSPIMGGDSGGPLFDLDGKLVAISSRIKSDVNQNLFVPVERYQTQWTQLASGIDVPKMKQSQPRTYLGILGETDLDRVRIRRVYQGSPADKAGLLENDVIISFDGKRIGNFDDVANVLKSRKPGEEVIAQLNRFGTLLNVSVRLGTNGGG